MIEGLSRPSRLAVLVSGNGSNLQALIDAISTRRLKAEIAVVVSNRADAGGLDRARQAGLPALALEVDGDVRSVYDHRLAQAVAGYEPDIVVLAGWMRILTLVFLGRFRVLNLHPAKPGCFPGTHAIERAFEAWRQGEVSESGAMVHWVPDEGVDSGPVIAWSSVPFEAGDTLETFEERMHRTEHRLLVEAIAAVIEEPQLSLTQETSSP